jgi:DNA repair exonuclease SbcCD nuclease subunit
MSLVLVVGDPHATVEELEDCQALTELIVTKVKQHSVEYVLFLGDLHHNHSVVRAEVLKFWNETFEKIVNAGATPVALVGNHDRVSDTNSNTNSLFLYSNVQIVDKPIFWLEGIVLAPWEPDNEKFLNEAGKKWLNQPHTLICHQTFNGSQYENGMYAKDGVDPNDTRLYLFKNIISGHIHTHQKFGKVWYIGSPRWRTVSDAGVDKNIFLFRAEKDNFYYVDNFDTSSACRKIVTVRDLESSPVEYVPATTNVRLYVTIHGSSAWVKARREYWRQFNARVATFVERPNRPKVSESEGIEKAMVSFLQATKTKYTVSVDKLLELLHLRVKK